MSMVESYMLVLSLFPGIGFLDMAFEAEGFCVVRGPDCLWGGDVKAFAPPAGRFDGVIGGPPCQVFSAMKRLNPLAGEKHGNLIPEFERCVAAAQPKWFLMENVPGAPEPRVDGYQVHSVMLNNRDFGEIQERTRRFSFGTPDRRLLLPEIAVFQNPKYAQAVTRSARAVPVKIGGSGKVKRTYTEDGKRRGPSTGPRMTVGDMLELQGAPREMLDETPFTEIGKRQVIGNGVPIPMGRAVAKAIRDAFLEAQITRTT